jgi:hypothetical protein
LPDQLLPTVRSRLIRLAFADVGKGAADDESREIAERVLTQAAASDNPGRRLETAQDLLPRTGSDGVRGRDQLSAHLRAMASLLRDAAAVATGADDRVLADGGRRSSVERLSKVFRGDRAVRAFAAVEKALAALDGNAGVKVVADWVVLQL